MGLPENVLTHLDELADVILSATEPAARNNGDALVGNEVWLDLGSDPVAWKLYDAGTSGWVDIGSSGSGGSGSYSENVGDGSATSFTVTHSLGTQAVSVTTYDVSGANPVKVETSVTVTGDNSIQVDVTNAPGVNELLVVVMGGVTTPTSAGMVPITASDTITTYIAQLQSIASASYHTVFDLTGAYDLLGGELIGQAMGLRLTLDGTVVLNETADAGGRDASSDYFTVRSIPIARSATSMKLEAYNYAPGARDCGWRVYVRSA